MNNQYFIRFGLVVSLICASSCGDRDGGGQFREKSDSQQMPIAKEQSNRSGEAQHLFADEESLKDALSESPSRPDRVNQLKRQLLQSFEVIRIEMEKQSGEDFNKEIEASFSHIDGGRVLDLEKGDVAAYIQDIPEKLPFELTSLGLIISHFIDSEPKQLVPFLKASSGVDPSPVDAFIYFWLKDASYDSGVYQNDDPRVRDFESWDFLAVSNNPVYRLLGAEIMPRMIRDRDDLTSFYMNYSDTEHAAILNAVIGGLEIAGTPEAIMRLEEIATIGGDEGMGELSKRALQAASRLKLRAGKSVQPDPKSDR